MAKRVKCPKCKDRCLAFQEDVDLKIRRCKYDDKCGLLGMESPLPARKLGKDEVKVVEMRPYRGKRPQVSPRLLALPPPKKEEEDVEEMIEIDVPPVLTLLITDKDTHSGNFDGSGK